MAALGPLRYHDMKVPPAAVAQSADVRIAKRTSACDPTRSSAKLAGYVSQHLKAVVLGNKFEWSTGRSAAAFHKRAQAESTSDSRLVDAPGIVLRVRVEWRESEMLMKNTESWPPIAVA
ncbi:hypothetical protein [Rhodoblastus sp.]|uniref:hypothetical protein n=1 Tax=Rhodoblastus sp. TaxID=1962975 RepID=UPI003F9CFFD0